MVTIDKNVAKALDLPKYITEDTSKIIIDMSRQVIILNDANDGYVGMKIIEGKPLNDIINKIMIEMYKEGVK